MYHSSAVLNDAAFWLPPAAYYPGPFITFWSDAMLSVNLLVLPNKSHTVQPNTPVSSSKPSPHLFYFCSMFCFHGRWPAYLSPPTPHAPFSLLFPETPGVDHWWGHGWNEWVIVPCVFVLYSTFSWDHMHGYCYGILFYYQFTEQKVAVKSLNFLRGLLVAETYTG